MLGLSKNVAWPLIPEYGNVSWLFSCRAMFRSHTWYSPEPVTARKDSQHRQPSETCKPESAVRNHFPFTRTSVIKKWAVTSVAQAAEKLGAWTQLVGMRNGGTTLENSPVAPQPVTDRAAIWPRNSTPTHACERHENTQNLVHKCSQQCYS